MSATWESIVKTVQKSAIKAIPFFLAALIGLGIHHAARGTPPDATLPVEVKDDESGTIMDWLTSKGVRTPRYDSAAAKKRLDPRDVVVADQRGNKYVLFPSPFTAAAKKYWELERFLKARLREELTDALKKQIPGIDNEGDVNAFPNHEESDDHSIRETILKTSDATQNSEQLDRILASFREIDDAVSSGRRYRDIAKILPGLGKPTVSVLINLPYQFKPEENVPPIQDKNEPSAPSTNPGSDSSARERESVPPLSPETIAQLKSLIADIAGIAPSDISTSIEISQVPWSPPVVSGQEPLPAKKPVRSGMYALPLPIEPDAADQVLSALADGAIKTAEYDADAKCMFVAVGDEKKAILALAEKGLLSDVNEYAFENLLNKWYDNVVLDEEMSLGKWLDMSMEIRVARLIEELESIAKAVVAYTEQHGVFGGNEARGAVWVTTKGDRELSEDAVSTIASLAAAGMSGLKRRNVFVVDQFDELYVPAADLNDSHSRIERMTEHRLNRRLRKTLTADLSQFVSNRAYEGGISVFPSHTVARDSLSSGIAGCPSASTPKTTVCDDHGQSVDIADLTVYVLVHLPYQLKRDAEGRPVRARNSLGYLIIDPETGYPEWEKESVPFMSQERIGRMKRHIEKIMNIGSHEGSEKILIRQIPWDADRQVIP